MPHRLLQSAACLTIIVVTLVAPVPAQSEDEPVATNPTYGIVGLEYENDLFAGRDRFYTNGVRATWIPRRPTVPGWLRNTARLIPMFRGDGPLHHYYALGQNMYTPEDITDPDPPDDSRPYAGWLYLNAGLLEERGDQLDHVSIGIGTIGPASQADRVQREIHRHVGENRPAGWDTQLHDEPTLQIDYERQWRNFLGFHRFNFESDVIPHAGGAVGNAFTYANAGLTLRSGQRLPRGYGPPRIAPARAGTAMFVPRDRFGWYLFAGVDGRAVARDITLDGNTLRESRSVTREPWVGEAHVGLVVNFGDVRISYTHVFRSQTFREQPTSKTEFGAMSLSWRL